MKNSLIILTFIFAFFQAESQSFVAKVSQSTVSTQGHFQVSFQFEGDGSGFKAPAFDDFMVLSGPNKSSSMQLINGNFSSSTAYSYILRPIKTGELTIGSASITIDDQLVKSNPVKIKAIGNQQSRNNNQQQQGQQQKNNQTPSDDLSSDVFMKLYVTKKDAYIGEQLVATYKLYLNAQVVRYIPNRPAYNGFYNQELEINPSQEVTQEVINGRQFTVATMKKVVLTPQKSGKLEVPPLELEMVVRVQDNQRRRRSLFDQFFGGQKDVKIEVKSNPELINVKPLPSANQPSDFIGAVGDFSLTAEVDRDQLKVNEAVNYTLTLSGKGNIDLINEPKVNFPVDFESYDPKTKQNIKLSHAGTQGSKSYEYVLIPRHEGQFDLRPVTMSYFDPKSKTYKRASTKALSLHIDQGDGAYGNGNSYISAPKKEDVQIIGKDIRYIKTERPDLKRREDQFFRSTLFYILAALPFGIMGALVFMFSFFKSQLSDVAGLKRKRAASIAKKHLSKARKMINGNDAEFYDEISTALFGYVSDKLTIPTSELNREIIQETLHSKGVSDSLLTRLNKALDECEMIRFAPGIVRSKEEMLTATTEIIESLEHEV
ncbi:MAG: BatD family protein [Salibacteraceae bacterium]